MTAKKSTIQLHPDDNIVIVTRTLAPGTALEDHGPALITRETVRMGHKLATRRVEKGQPILKFGQTIGFATEPIEAGSWVHVHNCDASQFERDPAIGSAIPPTPRAETRDTFRGYRRADGRVGTRNYIAIISTVNCSASTSKMIAERFPAEELALYPAIDGLLPLTHKTGCGMKFDSPDHHALNRVLAGYARHPNVGAYLLVGLGCEVSQTSFLLEQERLVQIDGVEPSGPPREAPPVISIQETGGIARTVEAGIEALRALLPRAADVERETVPASELVLGLQCGGSDGSSGVTANPALGVASDRIVAQGGTAILGETTEIYGAEHLLTRRASSREVGEKLLERLRWWEWYTKIFNAEINNNPSPGNKEGGLTTIYEKSLGAIAKGGSTALNAVYEYAEPVTARGLCVMDTPGYDPASLTGIIAGGANLCVFTTGRGSVFGAKPVPCIKVATNNPLYERMREDMDINAGRILDGVPVEEVGEEIYRRILRVASGDPTLSEAQGVGEEEFCPWTVGPVL